MSAEEIVERIAKEIREAMEKASQCNTNHWDTTQLPCGECEFSGERQDSAVWEIVRSEVQKGNLFPGAKINASSVGPGLEDLLRRLCLVRPKASNWPTEEENVQARKDGHYWLMVFRKSPRRTHVRFGVLNWEDGQNVWLPHGSSRRYDQAKLEAELGTLEKCKKVDRDGML